MYNFEYAKASDEKSLESELASFYKEGNCPKLLEIFTPRTKNDTILLNYFNYIK